MRKPTFLLFVALPACSGGCDEPSPPITAIDVAGTSWVGRDPVRQQAETPTTALEAHLGLRMARQTEGIAVAAMPTTPGTPFDLGLLTRRCWFSLGPRGLVANERVLVPAGAPPTADIVHNAVNAAIPDWEARAGVAATAALLILDAKADVATARALYEAVRAKLSGRIAVLVTDAQGRPTEVALPSGGPAR